MLSKPILSLMMWGPQNTVKFANSLKNCDFKFDPDQEKLHECSNYVDRDYWMYRHGEQFPCEKGYLEQLEGPAMTSNLVMIYPCNLGSCSKKCLCDFCEQTRSNTCPLKKHKKYLKKFDVECVVQKDSQCRTH
jgi:hypothetical protein